MSIKLPTMGGKVTSASPALSEQWYIRMPTGTDWDAWQKLTDAEKVQQFMAKGEKVYYDGSSLPMGAKERTAPGTFTPLPEQYRPKIPEVTNPFAPPPTADSTATPAATANTQTQANPLTDLLAQAGGETEANSNPFKIAMPNSAGGGISMPEFTRHAKGVGTPASNWSDMLSYAYNVQ